MSRAGRCCCCFFFFFFFLLFFFFFFLLFFFGGGGWSVLRDRETQRERTLMAIVVNGWFVDLLVECVGG